MLIYGQHQAIYETKKNVEKEWVPCWWLRYFRSPKKPIAQAIIDALWSDCLRQLRLKMQKDSEMGHDGKLRQDGLQKKVITIYLENTEDIEVYEQETWK